MIITIHVADEESIDSIKAVGAKDLCEYFLPSIGIKPIEVSMYEVTKEQKDLMLKGKEYTYYKNKYIKE